MVKTPSFDRGLLWNNTKHQRTSRLSRRRLRQRGLENPYGLLAPQEKTEGRSAGATAGTGPSRRDAGPCPTRQLRRTSRRALAATRTPACPLVAPGVRGHRQRPTAGLLEPLRKVCSCKGAEAMPVRTAPMARGPLRLLPPCRQPPADRRGAKSEWRQAWAIKGDRDFQPLI